MRRTTIALSEELAELVEHEARSRGTSVSAVIRELVAKGLGADPTSPREIPWAGIVSDPGMVPGARVDEALTEGWADAVDRDRR
ncbi:MAG: CopG family transcriptional regulator [Thermoanaerobaculia bacterium]